MLFYFFFFFFSSRRRHTRWNCDWSSDVCSSDLILGKRLQKDLPELADVIRGRRVAFLERDEDHAVIDADRRSVGESQVVDARRQADVVDDEFPLLFGDHLPDLVLDRLEDPCGLLDPCRRWCTDVKLDLPAVDQ